MFLEIITPEKKLFTGEIKLVKLPGALGSFEMMNLHAPMVSTLIRGNIKVIDEEGQKHFFDIAEGVIEMSENKIIVLAVAETL